MSVTTLNGLNVVITGAIDRETRHSASAKVAAAGAHVQERVTKDTNVLIVGNNVGATKTNRARQLGIPTITWSEAVSVMAGAPVAPSAPPTPVSTRNQPVPAHVGYRQVSPMLCKLATTPATGEQLYEPKWDGHRCIAHVNGETILASRSGKELGRTNGSDLRYAHVVAELDRLPVPCILDGELVVLDEQGRSDLERLNKGHTDEAKYVVFDVLEAQGVDIRNQPLVERRKLLATILDGGMYVTAGPVFVTEPGLLAGIAVEIASADQLVEYARENDLEGIVVKQARSVYKERSRDAWQKIKLRVGQEFVVVGYTKGEGSRAGTAGALLLAYYEAGEWVFCGSAGSGGTVDDFRAIVAATTPHHQRAGSKPIVHDLTRAELRDVTWVLPEVIVEVKFQRWTEGGKLWHPSIRGMRTDKKPTDVRKET